MYSLYDDLTVVNDSKNIRLAFTYVSYLPAEFAFSMTFNVFARTLRLVCITMHHPRHASTYLTHFLVLVNYSSKIWKSVTIEGIQRYIVPLPDEETSARNIRDGTRNA